MCNRIVSRLPLLAVIVIGIVLTWVNTRPVGAQSDTAEEPSVPFSHALGWELYQDNCAQCHGKWGRGADSGPPLLHSYYKRSHHGDAAFFRAIEFGSPQHHWTFGDMPPVDGMTRESAEQVVSFVRWLQIKNGIE